MKIVKWPLAVIATFCLGWIAAKVDSNPGQKQQKQKRVTSIGGIFFKCRNPAAIREWYAKHLGLNTDRYGTTFEWRQAGDSSKKGFTQWGPFNQATKYFQPSGKDFMINYRVENLALLVHELKKENVNIVDTITVYEYGKFIHIMDPEGNKIELWEPGDIAYEKTLQGITK